MPAQTVLRTASTSRRSVRYGRRFRPGFFPGADMNVLFFCHADFASNSMGHIAGFARGLRELGHSCAGAIPGDERHSAQALGDDPPLRPFLFSDAWDRPGALFPDGKPADILHAWTPREHVRRAVDRCRQAMPRARLAVHLEDNEEHLAAALTGIDPERLRQLPDAELAASLPLHLAHPHRSRAFLRSAHGITAIIRELADFAPRAAPFLELWPGVDFAAYHPGPPDPASRAALGLRLGEKAVFYPGNSHFANREELQSLYDAVHILNERGVPCRLIRTGADTVPFPLRGSPTDHVLHLGIVDRTRLPNLMRLADVLVQPGAPDAFNRYRLPSKLPEFFASGRPVLLPRANVGLRVVPGDDALLLETGSAEEIAAGCRRVFDDPALARWLALGAEAFAQLHFRAGVGSQALERFYRELQSPWSAWRRALRRLAAPVYARPRKRSTS